MLFIDTETFSETPINNGTYRYAEDCEVMLITYAFDNGPIGVVDLASGRTVPAELHEYLIDVGTPESYAQAQADAAAGLVSAAATPLERLS